MKTWKEVMWKCDKCDYAVHYAATLVKHRACHQLNPNFNTISLENEDNQSDIVVEIYPIEYWWGQRMAFPTLSKMALDILTAMPMSADAGL